MPLVNWYSVVGAVTVVHGDPPAEKYGVVLL